MAGLQLTSKMVDARMLLLAMLSFIASGESYHYTINGSIDHNHSLARRLGYTNSNDYNAFLIVAGLARYTTNTSSEKKVEILIDEWKIMLNTEEVSYQGSEPIKINRDLFEINQKKFDLFGSLNGKPIEGNRFVWHTLRIGELNDCYQNIKEQVEDMGRHESIPSITNLYRTSRKFVRETRVMAAETIVNNPDAYKEDTTNENKKVSVEASDDAVEVVVADTQMTDVSTATRYVSPPKRARSIDMADTSTHGLVERALCSKIEEVDERALDTLLSQCVDVKQSKNGDRVVLSYKDYTQSNGRGTSFVKVPTTTTDESHAKLGSWIDKALEINGAKELNGKFSSAKRTAKYIARRYKPAFNAALSEMKISKPTRMGPIKIAAMFKAGNVRSRKDRRAIMRHLRHHFGRDCFAPEYEVQMLCEGHSEVMTDIVKHAYDELLKSCAARILKLY